jgi:TPP-dependent pyruvate/acetoin dehydrogenase alpha subunit
MARDPLKLARARLVADGIGEEQITAAEEAAGELIDQAVTSALAAPYPDPESEVATEFRC